jgi:hypothetical protein
LELPAGLRIDWWSILLDKVPAPCPGLPGSRPCNLGASTERNALDERINVEIIYRPIAVNIRVHAITPGICRGVAGRIAERQHERIDVEVVHDAVAIKIAALIRITGVVAPISVPVAQSDDARRL